VELAEEATTFRRRGGTGKVMSCSEKKEKRVVNKSGGPSLLSSTKEEGRETAAPS